MRFYVPLSRACKGEAPVGVLIDHVANHFDPTKISDLEQILKSDPLDDGHDLQGA